MPISPRAYGAAEKVAASTKRFTNAGVYDETTNPTLAQVEEWINTVSSFLNVLLAEQGFVIPVRNGDVVSALAGFVTLEVTDWCNYANSVGRFFSGPVGSYVSGPWAAIQKEAIAFITDHAEGLENLGAARTTGGLSGLAFRDVNDKGEAIEPFFTRGQFRNRNTDFDS